MGQDASKKITIPKTDDGWLVADISDGNWFANNCNSWPEYGKQLAKAESLRIRVTNETRMQRVPDFFLQNVHQNLEVDLSGLNNVTEMGDRFLYGCKSLHQVDLTPLSNVTRLGSNFLFGCASLQKVDLSALCKVTTVGNCFLCGCKSLQEVELAGFFNLTQIGNNFMSGCESLKEVDFTGFSNVTTVGYCLLSDCKSLNRVELSGLFNVISVGYNFLSGCEALQQVDLSPLSDVATVGEDFLYGCESLHTIVVAEPFNSRYSGHIACNGDVIVELPTARQERCAKEAAERKRREETNNIGRDMRTLESSEFLAAHKKVESDLKKVHHLLTAVYDLVHAYANANGITAEEADGFFGKLQANAFPSGGIVEVLDPHQLMNIAVRLWTSAENLRGRELCGILNEAIRNDTQPAIEHAAKLVHAINAFCVTRRSKAIVRWPADNKVYRGGAMPRDHRGFFQPGITYRAPMFVATSLVEDTAVQFMRCLDPATAEQEPPHQEPVLWVFHFDATLPEALRCVHVNYIDRTDGSVSGEDEMLFAPYSVFTVRSVTWVPNPEVDDYTIEPHVIEVGVAPDNAKAPKGLPLAPWC